MKRLLVVLLLAALVPAGAVACEGMLALFADLGATDCDAEIGFCSPVSIYLMYVRDEGPQTAGCFGFRLLKSNPDVLFLDPEWVSTPMAFGTLEDGIDACIPKSTDWCAKNDNVLLFATIPLMNLSDPDTFTVSVVRNPYYADIVTVACGIQPLVFVSGGTFVFNGTCASPENPFGEKTAVVARSWGAIKSMYRSN